MDIKVKINSEWVSARDYQKDAFDKFKHKYWNIEGYPTLRTKLEEESINVSNNGYNFKIERENNEHHNGIFLYKENGEKIPITDFNSVKVFLNENGTWASARWYQTKAYYDFIYGSEHRKEFNFGGEIIFSISRNDNGTIYYEKNDSERHRVKISDNPGYISSWQGYYNRIFDPPNINFQPSVVPIIENNGYLPLPLGLEENETNNEEDQCVVCFNIQKNIKFMPCGHNHTCSLCYVQISKPKECPFCKQEIQSIVAL